MKTGETVRDGQGSVYQVGQLLGRGSWGCTYVVRKESTDTLHTLKCALRLEDVRGLANHETLLKISREILMDQTRVYESGTSASLLPLEGRFTLPDGTPAIILPRGVETLERRLHDGLPLASLFEILLLVARQLKALTTQLGGHGNLRPSNILFLERGDVRFTDTSTPALRKHLPTLVAAAGGNPYLTPEVLAATGEMPLVSGYDTYALTAILLKGIYGTDPVPDYQRSGLSKTPQVALKEKLLQRLRQEPSNPRFHSRFADRTVALIARGLSKETQPTPPYRFTRLDEWVQRVEEALSLIHPQVNSVGKIVLNPPANKSSYMTGETISFSCPIACTAGVNPNEEIEVKMAVVERERNERLKGLQLTYETDKQPSGRIRFSFKIAGLRPGHLQIRLVFNVKDAESAPMTTETDIQVRAAEGWAPPPEQEEPLPAPPLSFPSGLSSPPRVAPQPLEPMGAREERVNMRPMEIQPIEEEDLGAEWSGPHETLTPLAPPSPPPVNLRQPTSYPQPTGYPPVQAPPIQMQPPPLQMQPPPIQVPPVQMQGPSTTISHLGGGRVARPEITQPSLQRPGLSSVEVTEGALGQPEVVSEPVRAPVAYKSAGPTLPPVQPPVQPAQPQYAQPQYAQPQQGGGYTPPTSSYAPAQPARPPQAATVEQTDGQRIAIAGDRTQPGARLPDYQNVQIPTTDWNRQPVPTHGARSVEENEVTSELEEDNEESGLTQKLMDVLQHFRNDIYLQVMSVLFLVFAGLILLALFYW